MTADERRTGAGTGHADLDTLADLHADALEGPEAEQVRGHVAGCGQCAGVLAALDAVQGELRSLPAPAMPAAVAARLDTALADLRTDRSAPAGADPEDELALARLRRGRRLSRAIGAAAAAVVVLAAGGAIASVVRGGGGGSDTTAAGGAESAASAPVQPQGSGQRADKSLDGGPVATVPGAAPPALTEYDRASLRAALPTIATGVTTLAGDSRQAACAASIPGTTGSLRVVKHISYRGEPAYVFVYADGARLTGYVVSEECGSAPGQPARVLDTVS
jgi:hypothetical protein